MRSEKKPELAFSLISTDHVSVFQLVVSVLHPAASLFWFALTAPINLVYGLSSQTCLVKKSSLNQHYLLNTKQQTDKVSDDSC